MTTVIRMIAGMATSRLLTMSVILLLDTHRAGAEESSVGYAFDSSKQIAVQTHRNGVDVRVIGTISALSLAISQKGAAERSVALPRIVSQVGSLVWSPEGRVVALGMVNSSLSVITVTDIGRAQIDDYFFGYDPTLSPNGRYIAFVRFFPTHGISGVEDRARLYDLTQTAEWNRPVHRASDSAQMEVGIPMYPVIPNEGERSNIDRPDVDAWHRVSDFRWSTDSNRVAFGMLHGAHELDVVLATPSESTIATANLTRECGYDCESLRIEHIQFTENGLTVQVTGVGDKVGTQKHLVIASQEFSSQPLRIK
jgi:hypothetical protein